MRVLVLGGNGFVGSHVVDSLVASGHTVRVFDRASDKYRDSLPNVDYRFASFDDVASLAEALEGIDIVCHLISTTVPATSNKDPVFDVESNLLSTLRLLNLMKDSKVSRIIYLSSGGTVYGIPQTSPIPETHPLKPICSYGVVKVAIENYLHMYSHLYGIEYVVLRASNPYGERQGHSGVQGVIGTFINKVKNNESVEIWGDGKVVRDFVYVKDLADLCLKALESNEEGIYNAGSGVGCSINEIVDMLQKVSGENIRPVYREGRGYDVPSVVLDMSKTCERFSWQPKMNLLEGLEQTWKWVNSKQ